MYELNFLNVRAVPKGMLRRIVISVLGSPFGALPGVVIGKDLGSPLLGVIVGVTLGALLLFGLATYLDYK